MPDDIDTVLCAPDDGWRYHPKHVEQFTDINKQCNVASVGYVLDILALCMQLLWLSTGKCNSAVGRTAVFLKLGSAYPAFRSGATGCSVRLRCMMVEDFYWRS